MRSAKENYKHVQWRTHRPCETIADPVIAKGPEVMPGHSNETPEKRHSATGQLADHAQHSQTPRLRQALRILAPCR